MRHVHDSLRRFFRWSSIARKLTVFVGVVVVLNGAALIGATYFGTSAILQDQILKRLVTVATLRQEMLATTLKEHEKHAREFAERPDVRQLLFRRGVEQMDPARFRDQADRILANALATITEYKAIWIEDENGRVIASNGPANLIAEFSGGKRWTDNLDDDLVVPPHRAQGLFGLPVVAVIRTAEHEVLGAIVVLVDFGSIASILMDTSGLDDTGEVLVGVGQAESIRLITPTRARTPKSEERASGMPALSSAINGEFGSSRTSDYRDEDVLVAYRPVGRGFTGWGLIAKIDTKEAHAPVRRLQWLLSALLGAALVLGLFASNLIARRFTSPIRRLAKTSSAVAAGELSVRSEVSSSDELGAEHGIQPHDRRARTLTLRVGAPYLGTYP